MAGLPFELRINETEENFPDELSVYEVPLFVAKKKADALWINPNEIILTCDTVVIIEEIIFGKPKDEQDALNMLRVLSGRKHEVVSGVCIKTQTEEIVFSDLTEVYFHPLTEEQIHFYISTYKPFDKAGSYAIQEWIGAIGIKRINGCYFNVMGLPISKVVSQLTKMGFKTTPH